MMKEMQFQNFTYWLVRKTADPQESDTRAEWDLKQPEGRRSWKTKLLCSKVTGECTV